MRGGTGFRQQPQQHQQQGKAAETAAAAAVVPRRCPRFTNVVFGLSLLALLTTVPPFVWMLRGSGSGLIGSSEMRRDRLVFTRPWAARALVEDHPLVLHRPSIVHQGSIHPLGLSSRLKIYIYDLPSAYNKDWLLADKRCSSHLFAAEVAIHQNFLRSEVRTHDPDEADFFFMPVYVACNFTGRSGFPMLSRAAEMLQSAVSLVSRTMPYWDANRGRDHVFVATHDYGACFHAMEDIAVTLGVPQFLRNSIILQTFGQKNHHPCQDVDHIQIPPYVTPYKKLPDFNAQRRKIFAFFRGKMEIHPKNVSGHMYSRGVRTVIWRKFSHDRRFFIKRKRSENYREEMGRSVFCLCPLGWAPWSPRIVEAVITGCVPVIIADEIRLPFAHVIEWRKVSVSVAERDVGKLGRILNRVAATNLTVIQRNLWRDEVRRAVMFTEPVVKGDATWQVLDLLSKRKVKMEEQQGLTSDGGVVAAAA